MKFNTKQLTVTPDVFQWMRDQLWFSVDDLYDDPYGACDYPFSDEPPDKYPEPRIQIIAQIALFKKLARILDVNFDEIVKKTTTDYEQIRINNIIGAKEQLRCVECGKKKTLVDALQQECADCTTEPKEFWTNGN